MSCVEKKVESRNREEDDQIQSGDANIRHDKFTIFLLPHFDLTNLPLFGHVATNLKGVFKSATIDLANRGTDVYSCC